MVVGAVVFLVAAVWRRCFGGLCACLFVACFLSFLLEKEKRGNYFGDIASCSPTKSQTVSTYQDNQPAENVHVFEGQGPVTKDHHLLGHESNRVTRVTWSRCHAMLRLRGRGAREVPFAAAGVAPSLTDTLPRRITSPRTWTMT